MNYMTELFKIFVLKKLIMLCENTDRQIKLDKQNMKK